MPSKKGLKGVSLPIESDEDFEKSWESELAAEKELKKKLGRHLISTVGTGECSEPNCDCDGFYPRPLHFWECQKCRHGVDQHL